MYQIYYCDEPYTLLLTYIVHYQWYTINVYMYNRTSSIWKDTWLPKKVLVTSYIRPIMLYWSISICFYHLFFVDISCIHCFMIYFNTILKINLDRLNINWCIFLGDRQLKCNHHHNPNKHQTICQCVVIKFNQLKAT